MNKPHPFYTQLLDLLLIQLTNWRWSWRGTLITGMLAPLFLMLTFGSFAGQDEHQLAYVLTGNLVLSLLSNGLLQVSGHFNFLRWSGSLTYFATLPIQRTALILATVISFLLLALPSVIATLVGGMLILNMPLRISPWILLVIPVIGVTLSGLGAFIGLVGKTPQESNTLSLLATLVLFGFGPVLIPAERIPPLIQTLSLLSPATYAAAALREVVLGLPGRLPLTANLGVLMVFTAGFLWLVTRRLDWRGQQ